MTKPEPNLTFSKFEHADSMEVAQLLHEAIGARYSNKVVLAGVAALAAKVISESPREVNEDAYLYFGFLVFGFLKQLQEQA